MENTKEKKLTFWVSANLEQVLLTVTFTRNSKFPIVIQVSKSAHLIFNIKTI